MWAWFLMILLLDVGGVSWIGHGRGFLLNLSYVGVVCYDTVIGRGHGFI